MTGLLMIIPVIGLIRPANSATGLPVRCTNGGISSATALAIFSPPSSFSQTPHSATRSLYPSAGQGSTARAARSEEHTSELQSHSDLVCRLLLEKKKKYKNY